MTFEFQYENEYHVQQDAESPPMDQITGQSLGSLKLGQKGRVVCISGLENGGLTRLDGDDLERRLLEIGFMEGDEVQILHFGPVGRDPIAVRLGSMIVALRRREADAILVEPCL